MTNQPTASGVSEEMVQISRVDLIQLKQLVSIVDDMQEAKALLPLLSRLEAALSAKPAQMETYRDVMGELVVKMPPQPIPTPDEAKMDYVSTRVFEGKRPISPEYAQRLNEAYKAALSRARPEEAIRDAALAEAISLSERFSGHHLTKRLIALKSAHSPARGE